MNSFAILKSENEQFYRLKVENEQFCRLYHGQTSATMFHGQPKLPSRIVQGLLFSMYLFKTPCM